MKAVAIDRVRVAFDRDLFADELVREASERYGALVEEYKSRTIEIPKIKLRQKGEVRSGFHDFDLDTDKIDLGQGSRL